MRNAETTKTVLPGVWPKPDPVWLTILVIFALLFWLAPEQGSASLGFVLKAVLSVLPCDTFVPDPAAIMQVVGDPLAVPPVVAEMNAVLAARGWPGAVGIERHAFYAAAEGAYAIVQTGERRFYGNILLTKGVIPPE